MYSIKVFTSSIKNILNDRLNTFVFICIIIITISNLNLIGEGFFGLVDEFRYAHSRKAITSALDRDFMQASKELFSTEGRPGDAVIKIIPNAIQFISGKILHLTNIEGKIYYNNTWPLFIFNYITFLFILFFHYKLSKHIFQNTMFTLLSVLVYLSLTNSHLYLRHALPYDTSLLILYYVVYKIIILIDTNRLTFINSFLLGSLSYFGYLVYPGYIPLFLASALILFFYHFKTDQFFLKFKAGFLFAMGSVVCLFVFEGLSRLGSGSYIDDALRLSTTIIQGSFEESFSFLFKYFLQVEGITGIFLILFLVLFIALLFYDISRNKLRNNSTITTLFLIIFFVFVSYASFGYFLKKFVFYGRLLHQFFPFICIFSIYALRKIIFSFSYYKLLVVLTAIIFIVDFAYKFIEYRSYAYPRDIELKILKSGKFSDINYFCEYEHCRNIFPNYVSKEFNKNINGDSITLINFCYFAPVYDVTTSKPFKSGTYSFLVFSKPHFLKFKAYQYEGFNIEERNNIDQMDLKLKIYTTKPSAIKW